MGNFDLMHRNLLLHPYSRPEDLGKPLPDSPHATSVALPCWDHVVGYEEGRPEIVSAMKLGYPRFVTHPIVESLFTRISARHCAPGESCYVFPSAVVATRCVRFLSAKGWAARSIDPGGDSGIQAVFFPEAAVADAKSFWQHYGIIVSSRQAEAFLADREKPEGGAAARQSIRKRIAALTGEGAESVWLFPSGMAALAQALHVVQERRPGAKSIQIGFPYVDVLKIQTVAGPGAHFVPDYSLDTVAHLLEQESICAIVCEFPGNPLLQGCSLSALGALAHQHDVPLIVDDTAATYVNVSPFPHADIIVSSLTKAFSGEGDVMAGGLVLNGDGPCAASLQEIMARSFEELLWDGDALVLEANSRDFESRVVQSNTTAEQLCDWLKQHTAVESVYYPKFTMAENYNEIKRQGGGYGSLFSIILRDGAHTAPPFYDALAVSKGPSLGTNFTLACPYTLLAHFTELEWAEAHGVSPYLVRVSVGLEGFEDLKQRFSEALDGVSGRS